MTNQDEQIDRIVFDVSTLVHRAHLRPTGIDRVLLETAQVLMDTPGVDASFCRFDLRGRCYHEVPEDEVRAMTISMRGVSEPAEQTQALPGNLARGSRAAIGGLLGNYPATAARVRRSLGHVRRSGAELRGALVEFVRERSESRRKDRPPCFSERWSESTTYCSLGMDFVHNDLAYLAEQKKTHRFRVAIMIYDLIPVFAPHLVSRDYTEYFIDLVRCTDHALVISDATTNDLTQFASDHDLDLPVLSKVPLGSALLEITPERPALDSRTESDGFVLAVGTVTLRKNYGLLLDVWAELSRSQPPSSMPHLVIAGAVGGLSEETKSRMEKEPAIRAHVTHLPNVSDGQLAWLYRHCTFTVYPSLYEGWGLPVSESLDFGRVCVASDRTSVPEASAGLAVHLDAVDRSAWVHAIRDLWFDRSSRVEREQDIVRRHRRTTADDTTRAILAAVTSRGKRKETLE